MDDHEILRSITYETIEQNLTDSPLAQELYNQAPDTAASQRGTPSAQSPAESFSEFTNSAGSDNPQPFSGFLPGIPSQRINPGGIRPNFPQRPVFPLRPNIPPAQAFGQVRFLNASTDNFTVTISIDNNNFAINSRFGTITNYEWVADGFHTVTVRRITGRRAILYQQTLPFVANERVTMVLSDDGNGLDLVRVSGRGCNNLPSNSGCYRFANMTYSRTSFDLMLFGGDTVFRNVRFQSVTNYKQAIAGSYQFSVIKSGRFSVIREIPVIVIGPYSPSNQNAEPVVSFQADIEAGRSYTTYLIGNTWSSFTIRALTVAD